MEGNVNMSMVDRIPAITFSNHIKDILFKEMELMVILKLLGRNIGYNIRLVGLSGYLYKRKTIEAIGGLIEKVVKLDLQTDNRTRRQFACLAVFINLDKPLVSQVLVDGFVQRVEYEALPTVCFCCEKYSHVKKLCPSVVVVNLALGSSMHAAVASSRDDVGEGGERKRVDYRSWMLVERKSRRG
ncbi:hypothetical protein J1N35_034788 [Gossypium stocksii]|uniref:Zinc knuckle CX2CX4HX4C domain-containing protein n=1 Tax=Gossypium stocksii TaxID=47602 RepID=A0A9D3ZQG4_9ROSI|nr:hypothetical protein J1N35_034788 [Gossypium stocksii]